MSASREPLVSKDKNTSYGAATIVSINPPIHGQGSESPSKDQTSTATQPVCTLNTFAPWPEQVSFTFDTQPVPGKSYFRTYNTAEVEIAVCIPCYNEDGYDIRRTLDDLDKNFRIAEVETVHVVVVLDGIKKMSDTMRDTFIEDLGFREGMTAVTTRPDLDMDKTYFLQRDLNHTSKFMPNPHFEITCVVKGTNRKKHNSQEWFLRGFCPDINPKIAFLVDCGTCFDPYCVLYLKHSLDTEPGVIAVSGRARVMDVARQTPEFAEGNCLCMREDQTTCLCCLRSCLRNVQRYEMEATHVVDKPIFSAIGFLPVLPGPCVMMRYQNEDPEVQRNLNASFDWFFDFCHQTPEEAKLVGANLILAEDRILSYAMPISTGLKTKWVHQALFFFDAETETETLARQRRRWNSGTIAGHVWLFNNVLRRNIPIKTENKKLAPLVNRLPQSRRCCLKALIIIELFKIGFNAISPTVFLLGVYYGIQVIFNELANYDPALAIDYNVNEAVGIVMPLILLTFLMLFVVRHSTLPCGKFSGKVYDKGCFIGIMALGVLMSVGAIYAIYTTMRLKILQWDNEISVGFTFNNTDMTNIDVESRDYLDGNGHYMLLNKIIMPPSIKIPPTHPLDGKYAPINEVFQEYQEMSHSILSGKKAVTMLTFSSNAFAALTHPETETLHLDLQYIAKYGWEHVYPFCSSLLSNTSNCTTTNTMASLLGAWTAPRLIDKISHVCPEAVIDSVDPQFSWHVACQDWNFDHWFGLAITVLMLIVLFLPIATHILILELGPVLWMILGFIPYYMYLPTMVGAYGTYAIAQMNNLSWGNRQSKTEKDDEAGTKSMQQCVNRLVIAVIAGNLAFTIFAVCTPDDSFVFIAVFTLINIPAICEALISLWVMIFHYWCCCRRFRCCCRQGCCFEKPNSGVVVGREFAKSIATSAPSKLIPTGPGGEILDEIAAPTTLRPKTNSYNPPRPKSIRFSKKVEAEDTVPTRPKSARVVAVTEASARDSLRASLRLFATTHTSPPRTPRSQQNVSVRTSPEMHV